MGINGWIYLGTMVVVFLAGTALGAVGMGLWCLHLVSEQAEKSMKELSADLDKFNKMLDGDEWKKGHQEDKPKLTDEDLNNLLGL